MKKMLREPAWHRVWSEWQANREIQRLLTKTPSLLTAQSLLRVGFIGCGRVMRRHVYGYLRNGPISLNAAADPSPKQQQEARKKFGIHRTYTDFRQMLEKETLDIVSICAPPRYHAPATLACAQAGVRAILCEKPLGLNLEEADEMIRVCKEKDVLLVTGHQRRFGEQHLLAKQLLAEGVIGDLDFIWVDCPRDILRAGIHGADMLLDYGGPAAAVTASLGNGKGGSARGTVKATECGEANDRDSAIHVTLESGLHAFMRVQNRGGLDAKIHFLGAKGVMEVYWDGGLRYRRNQESKWQVPSLHLKPYFLEFEREIRAILDCLQGRKNERTQRLARGAEGRNSLELILAILTANESGRSVHLPLRQIDEPRLLGREKRA